MSIETNKRGWPEPYQPTMVIPAQVAPANPGTPSEEPVRDEATEAVVVDETLDDPAAGARENGRPREDAQADSAAVASNGTAPSGSDELTTILPVVNRSSQPEPGGATPVVTEAAATQEGEPPQTETAEAASDTEAAADGEVAAVADSAPATTTTEATAPAEQTGQTESPAATEHVPAAEPVPTPAAAPVAEPPLSVIPFLRALSENKGSDLHCKTGASPRIRIDGRLRKLKSRDLAPADTEHMLSEVIRGDLVEDFAKRNEADFGFSLAGVGRFRVNAYRARGSVGLVFRRVNVGAVPLTTLGVPEVISSLALEPRGLVLVTGPTGSGKTTTLAGMVDHINTTKELHIVTIEDPIEVLHHDKNSIINQREVGLDTQNFAVALRAAMRQDPDVVLVGEMRDAETVGSALAASETGHFVMSTLHTTDAAETITRVIDFFPPHEQKQVRLSLSSALRGIICQRLVRRADGLGRVVVMEICVNTGRIADAIADPEKTHMITDLIREGGFYGMQTFDQHLVSLFRDRVITLEDAMNASSNPHDLQVELRAQGLL